MAIVIFRRVCFPPDLRGVRVTGAARVARIAMAMLAAATLWWLPVSPGNTQQISLTLDDITGAGWGARGIRASFINGSVSIQITDVQAGGQSWKDVRLDCAALRLERARIACDDGLLAAPALGEKIPLAFIYVTDKRVLELSLKPARDETWHVNMAPGKRGNDLGLRIDGGRLQRAAPWLPPEWPKLNAGVVNGTLGYTGDGRISAKLIVSNAGFADTTGLHAGEKIGFTLDIATEPVADALRWNATLQWQAGESFWQPIYLKAANQHLSAEGRLDAKSLAVERGVLAYPGLGEVAFAGVYDLADRKILQATVDAPAIPLAALHEMVLKPFLAGTALAEIRADGRVSAALRLTGAGLHSVDVKLHNVSFEIGRAHV